MLNNRQLQDIQALQQLCENTDQLALKLNWEILRTRKTEDKYDYFHYAGDTLAGFLGIYKFGSKLEICGMVHPDYRRKGIFTSLLKEALQDSAVAGYSSLLLNAPAKSLSGEQFLLEIPCQYECSEYQMRWDSTHEEDSSFPNEQIIPQRKVVLRKAIGDDIDDLIRLDKDGFEMSDEDVLDMSQILASDGLQHMYIIESDSITAGKINVIPSETETWIYAFTVDRAVRGQGIGRRTLQLIIEQEQPFNKDLWLEVAVHNPTALKLYESCGFVTQEKQDYYQYTG
ncbi:GNAT family N-acetyltransferase [Paenibacillus sp. FA6]|uniref:GNAT family N-acetyltransferase n=1 Tax=Paenibacillus sp. FA6 TaxID=3413029 RepID=UPI003F658404